MKLTFNTIVLISTFGPRSGRRPLVRFCCGDPMSSFRSMQALPGAHHTLVASILMFPHVPWCAMIMTLN